MWCYAAVYALWLFQQPPLVASKVTRKGSNLVASVSTSIQSPNAAAASPVQSSLKTTSNYQTPDIIPDIVQDNTDTQVEDTPTPDPLSSIAVSMSAESSQPKKSPSMATLLEVNVKVTGPGISFTENVDITQGTMSVFEALKTAATKYGYEIHYTGSGATIFITGIGNVMNGDNQYWLYYLNGQFANKGAGAQTLKSGDSVVWVYG